MNPVVHEPHRHAGFECNGVATYGANPYREELWGDSTPEWMCRCQRYEAAQDI